MAHGSCAHCRQTLIGKQRKYCAVCASLASLLWNRAKRREWKAGQQPGELPYWRDGWKNKTDAERRRYGREYMRTYRQGIRRRPHRVLHHCSNCPHASAVLGTLGVLLVAILPLMACTPSTSLSELPTTLEPVTAGSDGVTSSSPGIRPRDPKNGPVQPEKVLPSHRHILEEAGWLEFVTSNVDAIEYYDWEAFASPQGPAVGLATYEQHKRVARLALKGRSDHEVVATLVHEAAHLSGVSQVDRVYGEDIAVAVEKRFRQDCLRIHGQPRPQDTVHQENSELVLELPSVLEIEAEGDHKQ